jgi:7,8-dihydro-6-hydroxymethylpterin dimethyltransferase
MLIKKTRSLCPTCNSVIDAEVVEEEGKIMLHSTCPEHGNFKNLYWSDPALYHRFERFGEVGTGIENPQNSAPPESCPSSCGLCNNHHSHTLLANIDLTNRCNLDCDFCFANARACGYVYEPDFDDIVRMMQVLRDIKPVPAPAVQFSGGEPTMREDLLEIIKKAKEMNFRLLQMATNGIKIAQDPGYARQLRDAGLNVVYLHFDGVTQKTNPLLKINEKAIENLKTAGLGVVLVPTIIRGKNDNEVGDIIRFAAKNISAIRGVNFQPIAFTGAATDDDVKKLRITIPDLLDGIEEQLQGVLKKDDFYPVPCVLPISDFVEALTGKPQIRFTAHPHCGAATYVFVQSDGSLVPVNRMVDVDKFFESITEMAEKLRKGGTINKYTTMLGGVKSMHGSMKKGVKGANEFWRLIGKSLIGLNYDAVREFHWNALFIGTMHFMDRYNYDLDRVQRCCIHYTTPDGKLIPFCTYNSGPVYREQVWKKYAQSKE